MGGNTRAINRETGEVIALAQKIDLTKINRAEFINELKQFLLVLNSFYSKVSSKNDLIWKDFSIVESGLAFNGSAEHLLNESISDNEFVKYKPSLGDIDLTVPRTSLKQLFETLVLLEGKQITSKIKYIGQNKPKQQGHQINALFEYDGKHLVQIDFEGVKYLRNRPTTFSKFAHSAEWADIKEGLKGVHHKFFLQNLVRAISENPTMLILTPKSAEDPNDKKFRIQKMDSNPRELAFSVDLGVRKKYYPILNENKERIIFNNKECYKELETKNSTYVNDVSKIFEIVFKVKPTKKQLKEFYSFVGLVRLSKNFLEPKIIEEAFDYLLTESLWGPHAQGLSRDSWKEDLEIKYKMLDKLLQEFEFLKKHSRKIKKMIKEYYKK